VDYKSFFCPANKIRKPDDARFWQFSYVGSIPGATPSAGPVTCVDESTLSVTQQQTNYRVLAYNYMFERLNSATPPVSMYAGKLLLNGAKPTWITKISSLSNSSSTVMIVDNIMSQYQALAPDYKTPATGCNFDHILGGLNTWGILDSTNHLSRQNEPGVTVGKDAAGGNHAYADGHVEWKNRREIKCLYQLTAGSPFFWW
jgi:hypothetical protein